MTPDTSFPPAPSFSDWDHQPPPASRPLTLLVTIAAVLGATFSAVSTADFMQFLDRQVHSIHCSLVPGAGAELGESGCRTVMMSPYSSFFRESLWGGLPISLWALAVFAFIAYRAAALAWRGTATRAEASFLLAATGLPLGMSVIYFFFSLHVGATCKVCVGMYLSSIAAFVLAFLARTKVPPDEQPGQAVWWFTQGVGFVLLLSLTFLAFRPSDAGKGAQGCGTLVQAEDPSKIMLELKKGKVDAIEVLDPLCPSCRAFDTRLSASSAGKDLALKAVLFPLDSTCNWMVTEALHPGACAVSEAMLCAAGLGDTKDHAAAQKVLAYAFAHQDELREEAAKDQKAVRARLEEKFPAVKGCLGSPQVKNKLTRSLRWAVANALPVLTPQLFVGTKRVCDEDTDLGLDYTLRRMLTASSSAKGAQP